MSKTDALITFGATGQDQVSAAMNKVSSEVNKTATRINKGTQAMNGMTKSGNALKNQFRFIRGGAGQVGHQIQDMAIQFQGGTHAAIVLGQQGSQIASLFGPQGAVIGAFGAVGAAIYTSLNRASVEAEKALSDMRKEIGNTAREAGVLSEAMREVAVADTQRQLRQARKELEKIPETATSAEGSIRNFSAALSMQQSGMGASGIASSLLSSAVALLGSGVQDATYVLETQNGVLETQKNKVKELESELEILRAGGVLGKTQTDEAIDSMRKQNNLLQFQIDAQIEAAHAQALYNVARDTELQNNPKLMAQKLIEIDNLFKEQKALNALLNTKDESTKVTKTQLTDAEKMEQKLKTMNEQYGKSRVEILRIQAAHAAKGDETLFDGLMAQIDEYASKVRATENVKIQSADIKSTVNDFTAMQEGFKTEEQLIIDSETNKLKILDEMYAIRGEKDQQYYDLRNKIQTEADNALASAERSRQSEMMGMMSTQLNQLSSFFDDSTALGKAAFVANQALAIGNAIISAEEASAKALALYPEMPAYAGMIKAMGYASAGAIAGQTLASFEGGGITFSGVRSGGMDGKGGRMAVVHPNEKITDMEKGGSTGQPVNVSFNISAVDSKGIDQLLMERRGMITSMVQKAVNNRGKRIM